MTERSIGNSTAGNPANTEFTDDEQKRTIRKLMVRLIPILALAYFFNSLEKTNIGLAALKMNEDLGLSLTAFGLASGLLFVGYAAFEVPSNLMLYKVGARKWISRIMVSWGLLAAGTALVGGETSLYILRILLGIAEAGFYPGVILYFTLWVPRHYRGTFLSLFVLGGTFSGVIGSPLTGLLLTPDDYWGIPSWRMMFVIEGIPAALLGVVCFFYLRDRPADAKWLTARERTWLTATIESETVATQSLHTASGSVKMLGDIRVLLLSFIYFCLKFGQFALAFFLPLIIAAFQERAGGVEYTTLQISLLVAIPSACAIAPAILWARHSDKTGERIWHATIPAIVGAVGIIASALAQEPLLIMAGICLATVGLSAQSAPFYQIPNYFVTGAAAAAAFGLINSLGNLGGFVAPTVFGALRDLTGDYILPSFVMGAVLILAAVLTGLLPKMFPSLKAAAAASKGDYAARAVARAQDAEATKV